MGKFISGLPTQNNLDKWADYAKRNSYGDNKAQCKDQLGPVGRGGRETIGPMTGSSLRRVKRGGAGPT